MNGEKREFTNEFYKTLLKNATRRKKDANARLFYWNCIKDFGYSADSNLQDSGSDQNSETEEDLYSYFNIPKNISERCIVCNSEILPNKECAVCKEYSQGYSRPVGFQESQNMTSSNIYGFNRTFIGLTSHALLNIKDCF